MIKIIDGNLLDSKADVIAHQVNCQGKMNSGVAKAIRNFEPIVFLRYLTYCKISPFNMLGHIQIVESEKVEGRYYANLFAQNNFGYDGKQYTNIEALKKCFQTLEEIYGINKRTIAMPYKIGCVRGGADWDTVYKLIEETFQNCNIELWRLDNG
jgi:O-acetyl-ADP-ribose deacetylase (regulator of RNase III)